MIAEGIIDQAYIKLLEQNYKASLESELQDSRKEDKTVITPFMQDAWKSFSRARADRMLENVDTTYPKEKLAEIAKVISTLPSDKKFIRKIERLVQSRQTMFDQNKLDWAMAEHLAYGSLLQEGYDVRIFWSGC